MIINVPLQIDEAAYEEVIKSDYKKAVIDKLTSDIEKMLMNECYNSYIRNPEIGLRSLVINRIDNYLEDCKDEIIAQAADRLAERLARTKRGKEILEEAAND